jgi:hypothetical protein
MIDYKYPRLQFLDFYDTSVVNESNLFITPKIWKNIIIPRVVPDLGNYFESILTFRAVLQFFTNLKPGENKRAKAPKALCTSHISWRFSYAVIHDSVSFPQTSYMLSYEISD